ncbi:MAG: GNAT family N-acetyltransferase [Vicinamibacterales bacterium]
MTGQRIDIRPITLDDAEAAARLSGELGYPVDTAAMRVRLDLLLDLPDHGIFVACQGDEVLGWIHVSAVLHLHTDPRAEIGGLVVTERARGKRVGARLVAQAEAWALENGFDAILVRSQIKRDDAHRFYLREGYTQTKTSAVFTKSLEA